MLPPPLPSRVRKEVAKSSVSGRLFPKNQSKLPPREPPANTASSALKSKPFKVPSKGKDIPSSLDSALFSNVTAKAASQSQSHQSPGSVPDRGDVIEISSESSDTPPSSLTGGGNTTNTTPLSPIQRRKKGTGNNRRPEKMSIVTHPEVIEIFDSDEELEMQRASSPIPSPSSQVLQSLKHTPPPPRTTAKGKLGMTTPSSGKSSVLDQGGPFSRPSASPSLSSRNKGPGQSSLSTSPTLSRFPQTRVNPTSSPSSPITDRALRRTPLHASCARKTSGASKASKEASTSASVSDDGSVNMSDLHAALGIPPPSNKNKSREDAPSKQRRTVKTARKSTGWHRPITVQEGARATSRPAGASGCLSASIIDLTASDEDEEHRVIESVSLKSRILSTPPTASDAGISHSLCLNRC